MEPTLQEVRVVGHVIVTNDFFDLSRQHLNMDVSIVEQYGLPLPLELAKMVLVYADMIGFGKRSVRWAIFSNGRRKTRRKRVGRVKRRVAP